MGLVDQIQKDSTGIDGGNDPFGRGDTLTIIGLDTDRRPSSTKTTHTKVRAHVSAVILDGCSQRVVQFP